MAFPMDFPMFPWFSSEFSHVPIVFLSVFPRSHGFPIGFPRVLRWFSHGQPGHCSCGSSPRLAGRWPRPVGLGSCRRSSARRTTAILGGNHGWFDHRKWKTCGLSMTMYDYLWFSVIFYDYLWCSMIFYGYLWLSMTIYDYWMMVYDYRCRNIMKYLTIDTDPSTIIDNHRWIISSNHHPRIIENHRYPLVK